MRSVHATITGEFCCLWFCYIFNHAGCNSVTFCFQSERWRGFNAHFSVLFFSSCSPLSPQSAPGFLSCANRALSEAVLAHRNYFNLLTE